MNNNYIEHSLVINNITLNIIKKEEGANLLLLDHSYMIIFDKTSCHLI